MSQNIREVRKALKEKTDALRIVFKENLQLKKWGDSRDWDAVSCSTDEIVQELSKIKGTSG